MVKKLSSKLVICVVITFFLVSVTYCVGAHSPSSMFLTYNPDEGTLTVDISHQVDDPDSHYVESIEIRKNGELIGTYDYTSQPGSSFDYIYDIDASDGDTIEVSAYCNQGGSITESMTLGATSDDSEDDSSTPGFELFTILVAIALTFILLKRKKVD